MLPVPDFVCVACLVLTIICLILFLEYKLQKNDTEHYKNLYYIEKGWTDMVDKKIIAEIRNSEPVKKPYIWRVK